MFLGDRTKELVFRAAHREVTAMVTLSLPGIDPKANPESFGAIIKDRKLFSPAAGAGSVFSQSANVWKFDDNCVPAIEKDPALLKSLKDELDGRTKGLHSGHFTGLDYSDQDAVFDSEDLVGKGTGIPSRLNIDFGASFERAVLAITMLPFDRLKGYLCNLVEKADEAGGQVHDVVITHKSSLSAKDYYKIAGRELHPGRRFSSGDYMLARATNALIDMGIPAGNTPPKPRYH